MRARLDRPRVGWKEGTAYHEAGHAIASYFHPMAGKTARITIRESDLPAGMAGHHHSAKTIPPIVGRAVDHDHVRACCIMILAGPEAAARIRGDDSPQGGTDYQAVDGLLGCALFSDDLACVVREIQSRDLSLRVIIERLAEFAPPLVERWRAAFEGLRAEARQLIDEKWACVEAVAKALYEKKVLTGDEVRAIIERVESEE